MCTSLGYSYNSTRDCNQIANYALVEWSDNIDIKDTPPSTYYPDYAKRFAPNELTQMLYWHALAENWAEMDYETFLVDRRKRIAQVIESGFACLS